MLVQATLGHSSLQVTERYSRAREGVALRAGAALNDAIKRADESMGEDSARSAGQNADKSQAEPAHPEPEMAQRRTRRTLNGTLMAQISVSAGLVATEVRRRIKACCQRAHGE